MDRRTERQKDRQTDRQRDRDRETYGQTDRHTYRQTDRQPDRQTGRQIVRESDGLDRPGIPKKKSNAFGSSVRLNFAMKMVVLFLFVGVR